MTKEATNRVGFVPQAGYRLAQFGVQMIQVMYACSMVHRLSIQTVLNVSQMPVIFLTGLRTAYHLPKELRLHF